MHFHLCAYMYSLFMNEVRKTFAAFLATMSIKRFSKQLWGKFCDVNRSGITVCTTCKVPTSVSCFQ